MFRKQRTAVTPVQRIVLNPVLEQSIVSHQESPRTTISQKIKVNAAPYYDRRTNCQLSNFPNEIFLEMRKVVT